jgi:hypothetical protein
VLARIKASGTPGGEEPVREAVLRLPANLKARPPVYSL